MTVAMSIQNWNIPSHVTILLLSLFRWYRRISPPNKIRGTAYRNAGSTTTKSTRSIERVLLAVRPPGAQKINSRQMNCLVLIRLHICLLFAVFFNYSTVTDLARLRGLSTSRPLATLT